MVLRKPALLFVALCASACADARGRFEDYQKRLASEDAGMHDASNAGDAGASGAGTCSPPDPGVIEGPALLAIDTSLTGGRPILFLGTIDTPALEGTTGVHFVYRALDSLDRATLVGQELVVGPFPLHDGELVAPVEESELDGNANPIIHGAAVTSAMTLRGQICGVKPYYCGTVDGYSTGLVSGPFDGKFAITLLDSSGELPARPRFGCGDGDLGEPLPN